MKTNPLAIEGQPGALKGHHGAVQSHLEQWRAQSMWEFLLEPCGAHLGAGWLSLMVQYLALMEQWRRSLSQGVFSLSSRGPSGELEIHLRAVEATTLDVGITTLIHSHLSWGSQG